MAASDDFDVPTLDRIVSRARDVVQALLPKASLALGTDYDIETRFWGVMTLPLFGFIKFAVNQIFPGTAAEKYLQRHAILRNLPRKEASISEGLALMRGLAGSTQPALSAMTAPSGIEIETSSARTLIGPTWPNATVLIYDERRPNTIIVSSVTGMAIGDIFGLNGNYYGIKDLPGGGAVVIYGRFKVAPRTAAPADQIFPEPGTLLPIRSKTTGIANNLEYGVTLTFVTPVVEPTCEVLELAGAADLESLKDWARRMQEVDAEKPAANNRSEALTLLLAQPGVGEGYIYDVYRGLGTADLVPQGVIGARHLGTTRRATIQNTIAPRPPTDANPGFVCIGGHDWLMTDFNDLFVSVEIILAGGPGYGPDWTGSLITAAGCTTIRINTTVDPRGSVAIGSKVVVAIGAKFIEMSEIISLDATGFSLKDELTVAPPAGRTILPGSNLIIPVRDALLELFGNLGPGDTTPPTRYPAPTTRGPDKLTLNLIHSTVRSVTGVDNALIVTPSSDITPPSKSQCTPLDIILRYA